MEFVRQPSFLIGLGLGVVTTGVLLKLLERPRDPDHGEEEETDDDSAVCSSEGDSEYSEVEDEDEMKMVLIVRNDLKMGKGKAAAQCCHATLAAYKQAKRKCAKWLRAWECNGQPKVTLKCDSEDELQTLLAQARSLGLCSAVIADAGRTQIAPGSKTVLAVGPAPAEVVDRVTGHLKLY